jgi:hypothetical protein
MATAGVNGREIETAVAGATVTLAATSDERYAFRQWTVVSGNATFAPGATANPATFRMPAAHVSVGVEFAPTYTIAVSNNGHGTARATVNGAAASKAIAGATVTLTATPAEGYALKQWTVQSNNMTLSDATANPATFAMPDRDVNIIAEFEIAPIDQGNAGFGKLTWKMYGDGTLTITGTGEIYYGDNPPPWNEYREAIKKVVIGDGVTVIPGAAFRECTALEEVTLPASMTSIGDFAFYKCTALKAITIPDKMTEINYNTFADCSALESVTFGSGLKTIVDGAFFSCSALKEITIPDGVTSIGFTAFAGCSALESVTIGSGVTGIDGYAFADCSALATVTCLAETPPDLGGFENFAAYATDALRVPAGSVTAYKEHWVWGDGRFWSIVAIE